MKTFPVIRVIIFGSTGLDEGFRSEGVMEYDP